jgi:hypothetical protein
MSRVVLFTFGDLRPRWTFGSLQNSDGQVAIGGALQQSRLSTAQVQVPVQAFDASAGTAYNPTLDTVQMAFVEVGGEPASGDWHTGSWTTAPDGSYLAQCLVGPSGVALTRGVYATWIKVTDSPEVPVDEVGTLQIT